MLKPEECGDGLCNHLSDTHIPWLRTSCHTLQHANLCLSLILRVCLTLEEIFCYIFLPRVKHQQRCTKSDKELFSAEILVSCEVTVLLKTAGAFPIILQTVAQIFLMIWGWQHGVSHRWTDSCGFEADTRLFKAPDSSVCVCYFSSHCSSSMLIIQSTQRCRRLIGQHSYQSKIYNPKTELYRKMLQGLVAFNVSLVPVFPKILNQM